MSELKAERSLRALLPVGAGTHAAHRALFLGEGSAIPIFLVSCQGSCETAVFVRSPRSVARLESCDLIHAEAAAPRAEEVDSVGAKTVLPGTPRSDAVRAMDRRRLRRVGAILRLRLGALGPIYARFRALALAHLLALPGVSINVGNATLVYQIEGNKLRLAADEVLAL